MIRVHLLRRFYPHWAAHSGINQYIKYIDPKRFRVEDHAIPEGEENFLPYAWMPAYVKKRLVHRAQHPWTHNNGIYLYKLNDMWAELTGLWKWKTRGFDLMHFLDGEANFCYLPGWVKKYTWLRSPAKAVATFHQPIPILEKWIRTDILKDLQHVSLMGPSQLPLFESFFPSDRISLIPHGIDTQYFKPNEEVRTYEPVIRCVSVGKWQRDYDTIIKVAKALKGEKGIEFHLVNRKLNPAEMPSNVFVHKGISDADLLKLYQSSDVLFLPLFDATANNVLLEGIACGMPIVSNSLESVKYYLPGEEALLSDDSEVDEYIGFLRMLRDDIGERKRRGKLARERALTYSWDKIAQQYEQMYQKIYDTP